MVWAWREPKVNICNGPQRHPQFWPCVTMSKDPEPWQTYPDTIHHTGLTKAWTLSHGLPTSSSHNSSIFPLELRTTQNQLICFEGRALHLLVGQSLIMKCWTHGVLWSGQTAVHLFGPPLCTKIQWVWREAPTKELITRVQHRNN